jgi:hypothetical protein
MSDIVCAMCGEPWDAYGVYHGDMTSDEAERFLAGEGCPACEFGTIQSAAGDAWAAAESELEWSDDDPMRILDRRGLL